MKELHPGASNIGFLVEKYLCILIPRSKLANPSENTSTYYIYIYIYVYFVRDLKTVVWLSPEILKGLGSSGRLMGSISTYPGTYIPSFSWHLLLRLF